MEFRFDSRSIFEFQKKWVVDVSRNINCLIYIIFIHRQHLNRIIFKNWPVFKLFSILAFSTVTLLKNAQLQIWYRNKVFKRLQNISEDIKSDVVIRIINKDTAVNDCQSSYNCTIYHLSRRSQLQEILEL